MSQKGRKSRRKAARFLEFPMRRSYAVAIAAGVGLVVAVTAALVVVPMRAASAIQTQVRQALARTLEVKGGAHLSLSPLAITLEKVSLSAPEGMDGQLLSAGTIRVPIGLAQLFGRRPDLSTLTLEGADIALLIDERDAASWDFAATSPATPLSLHLAHSSIRYFDARNGQALALGDVTGDISVDSDGQIGFIGSTDLRGRLARFDVKLKSLQRVHEDGSPVTINFTTPEITAGYDGRLSTNKVLSLAGSADISVSNLRQAARWAGLAIGEGAGFGPLTISGAVDSSGRAFAIRQANVALDQVTVFGDVVIDTRNATPKLQANLAAPAFRLDGFLPPSGATPGAWGRTPLGADILKAFDSEITLETPAFTFGTLKDQPARLVVTSAGGKLQASLALRPVDGSSLGLDVTLDAAATPPAFAANLTSNGFDAGPFLSSFTGIDWLQGRGSISAAVSGSGHNQEEIIGTLHGTASLALDKGAVAGPGLVALFGQASQRIVTGWIFDTPSRSDFTTFTADAKIADGIATLGNLKFDSPAITVTASGDIDLLRRAVDLRADPKLIAADGSSSGLPVKMVIKGPWEAPRIYPDVEGLLLNPQKGFETLKSMGLATGN
jgi:AsmA protein